MVGMYEAVTPLHFGLRLGKGEVGTAPVHLEKQLIDQRNKRGSDPIFTCPI
jgi:hypothetical protein